MKRALIEIGQYSDEHMELLNKQVDFVRKAKELNPNLRVIDSYELDQASGEKLVVGFVGYSGGKAFDPEASELALRSMLRQLDPNKVILSSGATNEGFPALVYRIGHEMGFKTLGVTSLQSGSYSPARMDYLLTAGNNWGHESQLFLDSADLVVAAGGGKQSYSEIVQAKRQAKPVILIANDAIGGASKDSRGRKVSTGHAAAQQVNNILGKMEFSRWLKKLPKDVDLISPQDVRAAFPNKKLIGITGWSRSGPARRDDEVRAFTRDLLSKLSPQDHIIVTSGSHLGAEKVVHEVASEMGFKMIAEVSHEIASAPLYEGISAVVPVARTWQGRTFGLVNNVDALVSYGGGNVVSVQLNHAKARGIPFVHMKGNVRETDYLAPASNSTTSGRKAAQILNQ